MIRDHAPCQQPDTILFSEFIKDSTEFFVIFFIFEYDLTVYSPNHNVIITGFASDSGFSWYVYIYPFFVFFPPVFRQLISPVDGSFAGTVRSYKGTREPSRRLTKAPRPESLCSTAHGSAIPPRLLHRFPAIRTVRSG